MNIFMRTFNNKINSKTGAQLPEGQYRGSPEWLQFQSMMIECMRELGHRVMESLEHPLLPPMPTLFPIDKRIVVHKCKRDEEFDLTWMQMNLRDLFTIDTNGWGADHSQISKCTEFFPYEDEIDSMKFCEELSDKMHASGLSKCKQDEVTDMTPEKFILVPVQIPRDYTIKHHSPITVKYFIDSVQAWAVENKYHVCFKMHPFNTGDTDLHNSVDEAEKGSSYVHKVKGNIHELIKRSQGVWVINSGTGFESLIHGKPVCTFGECDYSYATFNADIRRLDEARNFVYSYTESMRRLAYRFVYWYLHRHGFWMQDLNMKNRLKAYLQEKLA